ncbi:MAG TPA: hypothetical protein VH912_04205 [Streptosporangiaceae bacterium]|jgi:hypothetical protein
MLRLLKLRVAAALTLTAGAVLLLSSPAYAWPGARVMCDPSHRAFLCSLGTSGTPAPSTIRWYQDGFHLPAFDDLTNARGACGAGQVVTIKVKLTYVYPDGYVFKSETSDSVRCEGNQ